MNAADLMTSFVVTVRPDATIEYATQLMLQYRISGLPVTLGFSGRLRHRSMHDRTAACSAAAASADGSVRRADASSTLGTGTGRPLLPR